MSSKSPIPKGIRELAQQALTPVDGEQTLRGLMEANRILASYVLRVTRPEMRGEIARALIKRGLAGATVQELADAVMALLTEGT